MYTYYLCNDNETIYRLEFSIKPEEKEHYISLLGNYLTELVFCEEDEQKKLVEKKKIEKENKDNLSRENYQLLLEQARVTSSEEIEDYLPFVITVKTKKYSFLRSFTICLLIKLLSKDLDKTDSPYVSKLEKLLSGFYFDFSKILEFFGDESGNLSPERYIDYTSSINLLRNLKVNITEQYSRSALLNFWQGDEAERCIADGIVSDSDANKEALKKLNFEPIGTQLAKHNKSDLMV